MTAIPLPQLVDNRVIRPAETALALKLISEMDFLRLKAIARLHARGLPPDVTWDDLLQEAFTRMLVGSRQKPEGLSMVAFLAGVMRSLRTDHWRRAQLGPGAADTLRIDRLHDASTDVALQDPTPNPERALMARQEIAAISKLFAEDPVALQIIHGMGEGKSAAQIRATSGISKTDYDSARRRMRRSLLREGLTCAR